MSQTDRTQSEEIESLHRQIDVLQERLETAQNMAALGELLSTTTHEFNNVLMTILNYAKIGLRHKDEPTRDKSLTKIFAAGERAAKITASVLGMARNRSSQKEATDLASIVNESLILLERELNKYRISVEKEFAASPPALANGNQIQQVLLNLLINARQAMSEGGRVILRISHDTEANMVDLEVRDTGPGIPKEQLPRIFETFYSTKNGPDETGKGGSGVGLSSCRDIIESHNGRLRVESTVGVGTAFIIKLPVARVTTPLPVTNDVPASTFSSQE